MKTVGIIQARLGSSRLPGKVLRNICGQTMLERVVDRIERCLNIDQVVIATTNAPDDMKLVEYCETKNWDYFVGSEDDVLSRYLGAAERFEADQIVRITSDCPLIETQLVDRVTDLLSEGITRSMRPDYACNFYPNRKYPRGLDCEAITREALIRLDRMATKPHYREHVTLYAYRNPKLFTIASMEPELDHSNLRWTVDTEEDLELIRRIYQYFEDCKNVVADPENVDAKGTFTWRDVIEAYQFNPEWNSINQMTLQKSA